MERYQLFLACGPFPPNLAWRVQEECRHRVRYELLPGEPVRTDFNRCGLLDGLEDLFPASALTQCADWAGRAENGYYSALLARAGGVYAFAMPAQPEHAQALTALSRTCDTLGRRLTLFLY